VVRLDGKNIDAVPLSNVQTIHLAARLAREVKMSDNFDASTLRDLGEQDILEKLIAPRFPAYSPDIVGIGDDCAVIPPPSPDEQLVFTIDPCPTPVQCLVAPPDFYYYGWMVVLINVSDLAAMGATPLCMLISTVMQEDMPVSQYERFLSGVSEASQLWGCPVVGGNIKDGPAFSATGTALGTVHKDCLMQRVGSRPGDHVFVIGEMGHFWAAVLSRLENIGLDANGRSPLDPALFRPVARIHEGMTLAKTGKITSCMDSSDGVIGCLHDLATTNRVDLVVDSARLVPSDSVNFIASELGIDVHKLMLSWGDWQLVCTVPAEYLTDIVLTLNNASIRFHDIGQVVVGDGTVWLDKDNQLAKLVDFSSKRFSSTSFFTHGLESYVHLLRTQPISVQPVS
jgi:thiamine-monophosphate kinase